MKLTRNLLLLAASFLLIFFTSCGSSESESGEEDVLTETTGIDQNEEIKGEIEIPKPETREEPPKVETTVIYKTPYMNFTIQIGAYRSESNARKMVEKAKVHFRDDVYYSFKNNFFRVRIGKLSSSDAILALLSDVKNAGFYEAFVTQVDK